MGQSDRSQSLHVEDGRIGVTVGNAFTVFHSIAGTETNSNQC